MAHHLEQVVKYLDRTDKAIAAKNVRSAKSDLEQAETQWKTFHDWNKGKFDPKNPRVLAAAANMESGRAKVAALTAAAGDMAKNLSLVLSVILENEKHSRQPPRSPTSR